MRLLSKQFLFILLASSLVLTAQAQPRPDTDAGVLPQTPGEAPVLGDLDIERFTAENGLPANNVGPVAQDSLGVLWVGSPEGLVRYDGTSFTVYKPVLDDSTSLSHLLIEVLYVDRSGTLWVGTRGGGLNRFDPVTETFTHYRHDEAAPTSLSQDRVTAILEDSRGTLWVGTGDVYPLQLPVGEGGLNRYDAATGTFTRYRHDAADPTSLSNDHVRVLYEDRRGTLWVGTRGGGLNRFDPVTETFTHYLHDAADPTSLFSSEVTSLYEDSQGTFWVGTMGGVLHRFDQEAGTFERFVYDPGTPGTLSKPERTSLPPDCVPGDCGAIRFIDEDASGVLWIGTRAQGLLRYDPATGRVRHHGADPDDPNSVANSNVYRMVTARDGTRWIGNAQGGLLRVRAKAAPFPHYAHEAGTPNSLSHNVVWGLHADDKGLLWIATRGGGLNQFNPQTGSFTHYRHDPSDPQSLSSDSLVLITEDRQGTLWIGSARGLNRFDKATGRVVRYLPDPGDPQSLSHPLVSAILEDHAGRLWVGTIGGGLNRFDPQTETFTPYRHDEEDPQSLTSDLVIALHEDEDGTLWVGTAGGLDRFDPDTETVTRSLGGVGISTLLEDRSGRFWVGTFDTVLHLFDRETGTSTSFTTVHGLPGATAAIVEDDAGRLWVSTIDAYEGNPVFPTAGSLARFDPETQSFRTLGPEDGLPEIAFNVQSTAKDPQGRLYFGGPDGFIAFDPASVGERPTPKVMLTGLRIFNDEVVPGEGSPLPAPIHEAEAIRLAHGQHDFTIDYAGLDYYGREPLRYQYLLENYDEGWVEARGQQSARYSQVAPGQYVFRVRATRPGEGWPAEGVSIGITVLPPWWRTWWAFGLYGLLFIAGVLAVDRVQRRRLIKKERERASERELAQEKAHAREIEQAHTELQQAHTHLKATQAQLVQQEKLASLGQLTAGIAHEIKNPLNFVNNFAEVNEELADELREALARGESVDELLDDLKQNAQVIAQHGKRADGIVRAMMQHASGSTGQREATDINALVSEHIDLAYHGKRAQVPDLQVEIARDLEAAVGTVEMVPQEIGRVLLNLLGNAFDAVHERADAETRGRGDTENGYAPTVTVSTRRNGEAVEIRVSDNGPGIPAVIKAKIFEPFFTTKPTGSGTGLGLSLSYDIVTQGHGGTLSVESTEGQGATFVITLPHEAT